MSVWIKHGYSAKHLFGTQLNNVKRFAESHTRVQSHFIENRCVYALVAFAISIPTIPLIPATIHKANKTMFVVYRYLVLFFQ